MARALQGTGGTAPSQPADLIPPLDAAVASLITSRWYIGATASFIFLVLREAPPLWLCIGMNPATGLWFASLWTERRMLAPHPMDSMTEWSDLPGRVDDLLNLALEGDP